MQSFEPDQDIPRIAGHFIVMTDRVFIESSASPAGADTHPERLKLREHILPD